MKITLIMLETLNGYIAKSQKDKLKWGGKADKINFKNLSKEIGTIIMGSSSFDALGRKPLSQRNNIIMTRTPEKYSDINQDNFTATSESPIDLTDRLKSEGNSHIAVVGGAKINLLFFQQNLIDEIIITIAPKIFAEGTQLISPTPDLDIDLKLLDHKLLDENTLNLHYQVVK